MQTTLLPLHSFLLELELVDAPYPSSPSVPILTPQLVFGDCKTLWEWVRGQHFAAIIQSLEIEVTLDATLNCIWIYVNLIDFDLGIRFVGVHWLSRTLVERAELHTI
jgi:hypothetical protein